MKKLIIFSTLTLSFFASCQKSDVSFLKEEEKSDLLFLREEEKLAHDVYVFAYEKYGLAIFNNISASEQTHTTQVLNLINTYGLQDPVGNNGPGQFVNADLQNLYFDLTAKASISLNDALQVGAMIEDLDISDIKNFRNRTTKPDLLNVYDKLTCGSRNHLRAFSGFLETYTPSRLTLEEYDEILIGAHEHCGW